MRHDGVRLVTKAMSTYRTDSAARLQASACGALAALADRVESVLGTTLEFSVRAQRSVSRTPLMASAWL